MQPVVAVTIAMFILSSGLASLKHPSKHTLSSCFKQSVFPVSRVNMTFSSSQNFSKPLTSYSTPMASCQLRFSISILNVETTTKHLSYCLRGLLNITWKIWKRKNLTYVSEFRLSLNTTYIPNSTQVWMNLTC